METYTLKKTNNGEIVIKRPIYFVPTHEIKIVHEKIEIWRISYNSSKPKKVESCNTLLSAIERLMELDN